MPNVRWDLVERALSYSAGAYTVDGVRKGLASGQLASVPLSDSILLLGNIPSEIRVLNAFLAAGDMDELKSALPIVADMGREMGCQRLMLTGRKGWTRELRGHADHEWVMLGKDL